MDNATESAATGEGLTIEGMVEALNEAIIGEIKDRLYHSVLAVVNESDIESETTTGSEGGKEALYRYAVRAGMTAVHSEQAEEEASRRLRRDIESRIAEALALIREIEGRRDRPRTFEEDVALAGAREAVLYGPEVLRFLDGEEIAPFRTGEREGGPGE